MGPFIFLIILILKFEELAYLVLLQLSEAREHHQQMERVVRLDL
jgi:hypothetical protein